MVEDFIKHFTEKILVTLPVKITKVYDNDSFVDIVPLVYDGLDLPVIVKCPFLHIGNKEKFIKIKTKVGNLHYALFSQLDLGNYLSNAIQGQVNSTKKFSMNNCTVLPTFAQTEKDSFTMPQVDFEITGDIKINGNIEHNGNMKQIGDTEQQGNVKLTGDTEQQGNVNLTGDTTQTGNLNITGEIINTGNVTSTGTVKGTVVTNGIKVL